MGRLLGQVASGKQRQARIRGTGLIMPQWELLPLARFGSGGRKGLEKAAGR